ncbi:hypothetical protein KDA82_28470 [Streptomyces daliensis]|uniref:Uncharacterized protein n=1 Tax=Streptomyces daliensis TaxID=299421 RepID=A0A8T4IZY2_9ACTN|nr:hypothetical protein [Streptomyces daliensis]
MASEFGDLDVSEKSLKAITKGLRAAIGELKELDGFASESASLRGAGFSSMAMTGLEAGDGALADSFEGFCERWEWGVRALVGEANVLAEKLGLAAGMVWEQDAYWAGTWKVGLNSLVGNPYASEDDVAGQSYSAIIEPDAPETPAQQKAALSAMGQEWKDTGRSLSSEGLGGARTDFVLDRAGIPEEARERALDDTFGPSPEDRARQQGDEQGAEREGDG